MTVLGIVGAGSRRSGTATAQIGRITAALGEKGQLDNTLILFLQDNGGCAEGGGRGNQPNPRGEEPAFDPLPPEAQHYFGSRPKQTRDGWPVRRF